MDTMYRVAWRFSDNKIMIVRNFQCPNLRTLMHTLDRSEGVTPTSVAELVVHKINSGGTVTEMLSAVDPQCCEVQSSPEKIVEDRLTRIGQELLQARQERNAKPRIRLRAAEATPVNPTKRYDASGLYSACAA